MLIDFRGGTRNTFRYNLDAQRVLSESGGKGWITEGPLKGKIVLLGGDYAVQDEHRTPLGWMLGVEVIAQIVETELRGSRVAAPSEFFVAILMAIDSLFLFLVTNKRSIKKSILISVLATPVLAAISSWVAVRSLTLSVYFTAILFALVGFQLYESRKETADREKVMSRRPQPGLLNVSRPPSRRNRGGRRNRG